MKIDNMLFTFLLPLYLYQEKYVLFLLWGQTHLLSSLGLDGCDSGE
jgi:hypothetical protein